jgi:hypothetical protein
LPVPLIVISTTDAMAAAMSSHGLSMSATNDLVLSGRCGASFSASI